MSHRVAVRLGLALFGFDMYVGMRGGLRVVMFFDGGVLFVWNMRVVFVVMLVNMMLVVTVRVV